MEKESHVETSELINNLKQSEEKLLLLLQKTLKHRSALVSLILTEVVPLLNEACESTEARELELKMWRILM